MYIWGFAFDPRPHRPPFFHERQESPRDDQLMLLCCQVGNSLVGADSRTGDKLLIFQNFLALKMEDRLLCTVQNLGLKTPVQITNPEEKSKNPCLLNEKRSTATLLFATSVTPAGQEDKTKNSNPFFQSGQSPLSLSVPCCTDGTFDGAKNV